MKTVKNLFFQWMRPSLGVSRNRHILVCEELSVPVKASSAPALNILHKYPVSLVLKRFLILTFKNVLKLKYLSKCPQEGSQGQRMGLRTPDPLFFGLSTKISQNGICIHSGNLLGFQTQMRLLWRRLSHRFYIWDVSSLLMCLHIAGEDVVFLPSGISRRTQEAAECGKHKINFQGKVNRCVANFLK